MLVYPGCPGPTLAGVGFVRLPRSEQSGAQGPPLGESPPAVDEPSNRFVLHRRAAAVSPFAERMCGGSLSDSQAPRADDVGDVAAELVAYLIVAMPDLDSLANVVPALAELVAADVMCILDVIVLERDSDGTVAVLELEDVGSMAALAEVEGQVGGLLSDGDIEFCAFAIRPGTAGIVLVTEDRWAQPLAVAARRAGGHIVAGERIPATRVEAVRYDADTEHDVEA